MLMSLALDGALDDGGRQVLEDHVATCTACRAEWQAMQALSGLFERSEMVGPPLGFALRVERSLDARERKRRRTFGGMAVLTGSLSLAGLTVAAVCLIVAGIVAWQWLGPLPAVQQGTSAISQVASGMGLVGKGASFFLGDLLLRYGPPLIVALGVGLVVLLGLWTWLFVRRPGKSRGNGYA
jgi:anti-sigma factor RsiW